MAGCSAVELFTVGDSRLSGTLVSKGAPIPDGSFISLLDPVSARIIQQVRYSAARSGGRFEFTQLPPGAYVLSSGFSPANGSASHLVPQARVYYPEVFAFSQARPINVKAGRDTTNIKMSVVVSPTRTLDISVTRNGMLEPASVSILDLSSGTEAALPVFTGGYKINLYAGRAYRLVAYRLNNGVVQHSAPVTTPREGNQILELRIAHEGFIDHCVQCRR